MPGGLPYIRNILGTIITSGGDIKSADPGGTTVVGLDGIPLSPTRPANGQVLVYVLSLNEWVPETLGSGTGLQVVVVETLLTPSTFGNFSVPHGLGVTPGLALIEMTSGGSIWFQPAPRYDSTYLYLTASAGGVTGKARCWIMPADLELPLNPTSFGNFSIPHGLSITPALTLVQMTSGGSIWDQSPVADTVNINLTASAAGLSGWVEMWELLPYPVIVSHATIPLTPSTFGNFSVSHGLGVTPRMIEIRMTSGGAIWVQSPPADNTNLLLIASAGGITGYAEVWT